MTALVDFRAAIKTTLAADARLAGVTLYTHGGDFDRFELKKYAIKTPAVVVSVMRLNAESQQGGLPICNVHCAAVVLTADRSGLPKDVAALRVVDALVNILCRWPRQFWGLTEVRAPEGVRADNCYTKEIDAEGVAVWAVTWSQQLELSPSALVTDAFETLDVQWDLAPRDNDADLGEVIDAEDQIDLT